jgi:hypothetical protein
VFDKDRLLLLKLRLTPAEREALIKIAIAQGTNPSSVLREFIHQNAPK